MIPIAMLLGHRPPYPLPDGSIPTADSVSIENRITHRISKETLEKIEMVFFALTKNGASIKTSALMDAARVGRSTALSALRHFTSTGIAVRETGQYNAVTWRASPRSSHRRL